MASRVQLCGIFRSSMQRVCHDVSRHGWSTGRSGSLRPCPLGGDLFYDIEGDPFYREDGAEGLEYLHGVRDGAEFTSFWAFDHAAEKEALIWPLPFSRPGWPHIRRRGPILVRPARLPR